MAHLLQTVNPQAHARLVADEPLPGLSDMVLFVPRPSEIRMGKRRVPAVVLGVDEDNRLLDLLVIYDVDDFHSIQKIPRHVGEDRGWEPKPAAAAAGMVSVERFEAFQSEMAALLLGDAPKPDSGSFLESMTAVYERLDGLDTAVKKLGKK